MGRRVDPWWGFEGIPGWAPCLNLSPLERTRTMSHLSRTCPQIALLCGLLLLSGCATKRFGRMQEVSYVERTELSCREIDIEIAKTRQFLDQINEDDFDGRDILGFLGDFGIGNAMERSDAVKSGQARLEELQALRAENGCP